MLKIYDSNEMLFKHNGIKTLHPLVAEITKQDNGDYYLELRDIVDNLEYYQKGMIVRVPTPWGVQGFRCDNPKIKKRNNKKIALIILDIKKRTKPNCNLINYITDLC